MSLLRRYGKTAIALVAVLFLAACASYNGRDLRVGTSTVAEVEARMGTPALRWQETDGSSVLAFPRGPAGYHTFMARIGPDGRLASLENVLEPSHFARILPGMDQDQVLRVVGPPVADWTRYFPARDELVWEWRYCDDWNEPGRFDVFFDGTSGRVRSAAAVAESQRFIDFGNPRLWCGH